MIVGVDIGATKTLIVRFDGSGQIAADRKILTEYSPGKFLPELVSAIQGLTQQGQIDHLVVASRGEINFESLSVTDHKILGWDNLEIGPYLQSALKPNHLKFIHDTHAGALYEAQNGSGKSYGVVLYITISTGIGIALTVGGKIVDFFIKTGGGDMIVGMSELGPEATKHSWENRVSGTAIKARFGKEPFDLRNASAWQTIGKELALGINNCVVLMQPDIVVLGGGVSNNFDRFSNVLVDTLTKYTTSQYPLPPIVRASNVDKAVVLGTYSLVKDTY